MGFLCSLFGCSCSCPNPTADTCASFLTQDACNTKFPCSTTTTPKVPPTTTTPSGYPYLGCYVDKSARALPTQIPGTYSYADCASAANAKGATYFGLQNLKNGKGQCFYTTSADGKDYQKYGLVPTTAVANQQCTHQPDNWYGGSWSNAVYQISK